MTTAVPADPRTAIIDAAIATISKARSNLGVGPPTTGYVYQAAAERAGEIRLRLRTAPTSMWLKGSVAGIAATFTATKVARALAGLQEISLMVADCLDAQAAAVSLARRKLDAIATNLATQREYVLRTEELSIGSAMPVITMRFQSSCAAEAVDELGLVSVALIDTSKTNERTLSTLWDRLEGILTRVSLRPSSNSKQIGSGMSTSTDTLQKLASTLSLSSADLLANLCPGPNLFAEVSRTHGTGGVNSEFPARLEECEAHYAMVLTFMRSELDRDAGNALTAASRYAERDGALAQELTHQSEWYEPSRQASPRR